MSKVEQWRQIEGYGGVYEVSDFGRVRSSKNNKWGAVEVKRQAVIIGNTLRKR